MSRCASFRLSTVFAAALLSGASSLTLADVSSAVHREDVSVKGLEKPAEIIVDFWGVAHLYAKSDRDALFLQGYNAARDRLWQIDLWRKRGLGLLAENFGENYVDQDRATRMFLYRGDMKEEWSAYGPNGKKYATAFVDGVNSYVQKVLEGDAPLPVEFEISDTKPDIWKIDDVVRVRSHGLTRNASSEVARAQVACKADLKTDVLRRKLEPQWEAKVPEGLDPCLIPEDVLKDYELAIKNVEFAPPEEGKANEMPDRQQASTDHNYDFLQESADNVDSIGSNNWTISPDRTETGRAILANDPHRSHGVPSLRYVVHLNSPNMSVIGAGEPALPGISIGHNEDIAFGLTIFSVDQEDLYVYEINPDNPDQYRYNGEWNDMEVEHETVDVRGGDSQDVTMRYTRHGAVLKIDKENNRAFALRTVWFEPGTSAYFGSADYMGAKNWQEFSDAMQRFSTPSENQVYADTKGNIGWVVGAMTPTRQNWDGLLPVPGDGRYEWEFLDRNKLPSSYNPEKGWIATANQMNLPEDFPYETLHIGFEWADPSRYERISNVLSKNDSMTLADSMDLQNDDTSMLALRLVDLVNKAELQLLEGADPSVSEALNMLKNWDGVVSADSSAAVVGELMIDKHLGMETVERVAPDETASLIAEGSITSVIDLLEAPDDQLGDKPEKARNDIIISALTQSVEQAKTLLGDDLDSWRWGSLHKAYFENSVVPIAPEYVKEQLTVGPLEMGGSRFTPRAARYNSDFEVTMGASFRMVLDVGNWDASRFINTPGQSGDPFSAHYRDLTPLWAAGEYVPLVYSREAVESNASQVMNLTPQK